MKKTFDLNAADEAFTRLLSERLPADRLCPFSERYVADPRGNLHGKAGVIVAPRSTDEVSAVVRLCAEQRVPIVPFGGGTGLVGGQVMTEGPAPVVLSLERMNRIRDVLPLENVLIAEAGATLMSVQQAAEEADRLFPLSLASEGSCQIGGNLATNAGGVNVLRYGNTRDLCLGLEAVMPDGDIWHGLTRLRKDNTGFDLRNLLIGSEGALGIITAASLRLFPQPDQRFAAFLVVQSPRAALQLLSMARDIAGEVVSAFELIKHTGLEFLSETHPDLRQPFDTPPEWSVLIELGLQNGRNGESMLMQLFEAGSSAGLVTDGLIAQSESQRQAFWKTREHIPEANRGIGAIASHDISLPLGELPQFIDEATAAIAGLGPFRINCFGHVGDGNLHFNIFPPAGGSRQDWLSQKSQLEETVYECVHAHQGSFSAEHGVGRIKTAYLERYADPTRLATLKSIKQALDPQGIMNPGAVLQT